MSTYERPKDDHEIFEIMEGIRGRYHEHLDDADVTVGVLLAFPALGKDGQPVSPAIKVHGVPAAACVKINSLKARAEGLPDATITVDGRAWETWTEARRRAVLDHELYHLEIARDGMEEIKSDDLGRPKLKIRPHDFEVGWFRVIAERHGTAAFEVAQASMLADSQGQLTFPWFHDRAEDDLEVGTPLPFPAMV